MGTVACTNNWRLISHNSFQNDTRGTGGGERGVQESHGLRARDLMLAIPGLKWQEPMEDRLVPAPKPVENRPWCRAGCVDRCLPVSRIHLPLLASSLRSTAAHSSAVVPTPLTRLRLTHVFAQDSEPPLLDPARKDARFAQIGLIDTVESHRHSAGGSMLVCRAGSALWGLRGKVAHPCIARWSRSHQKSAPTQRPRVRS